MIRRDRSGRRKGADFSLLPALGQHFSRQHEVNWALGIALHDAVRAAKDFLGGHAGRQRILPLHEGPHDARLIEWLLDEVYIVIARAFKLAEGRERRRSGNQHHRDAAAKEVVHSHGGVRGAGIDVYHDRLTTAGHNRVAAGHMDSDVLVRTDDDFRRAQPFASQLAISSINGAWSVPKLQKRYSTSISFRACST